ncbi:MAG TPA: SHOCT domain-containing protein [Mycobacteriales bacterium]|nr:SHOCT domain-containing protein [Mycobacteriales bacterium]
MAPSRLSRFVTDWTNFLTNQNTPEIVEQQYRLMAQHLEAVAQAAGIPAVITPSPQDSYAWSGRGLGKGSLQSANFECHGDWYTDESGLYLCALPELRGYNWREGRLPMMVAGMPTLRLMEWRDVTRVIVDGVDGTSSSSTTTTRGKHRQAYHVLGSSIQENATTETTSEGHASVVFEKASGPDVVMYLSQVERTQVRQELSAVIAAVRQRREQAQQRGAASNAALGVADELAKLAALVTQGALTQEEFLSQKARLLGG